MARRLHSAAQSSESSEVVNALMRAGGNSSAQDLNDKTPWNLMQQNDALTETDAYWTLYEAELNHLIEEGF